MGSRVKGAKIEVNIFSEINCIDAAYTGDQVDNILVGLIILKI